MTEILCRWLNDEVGLSRHIDHFNFAKEFATGYLLGELLEKHALQNDFADFSQNTTADSKLNNFTRLEPTLKLLEVPYDTNIAHSIMNENHSVVTRLLYQLFITLGKKNKMGLTGVAMETMRPSGPVKLESIESGMYKEKIPLQAAVLSTKDLLDSAVQSFSRELILEAIDETVKDIVIGVVKDLQEISVILVSDTKSLIAEVKELSSDKRLANDARKVMKNILETSKTVMNFRLKQLTKRQVDLNFENLVQRYQAKQKQQEELAFKAKFEEEENVRKYQQAQRIRGLEKSRQVRNKQQEMIDKIRDATVKIPKPPDTRKSGKSRGELRRQREAEEVKANIDAFEASMKATIPPVSPAALDDIPRASQDVAVDVEVFIPQDLAKQLPDPLSVIKPGANKEYVNKIRTRLEEDAVAREEREKRRRRVLVEQLKAHEAQEEAHREEMLVNRLMRQSQQERRIAVQLMQVRHEKEVIRQNRIFREQQYAERRLKDFDDALEREAEMCRQAKLEYAEETRKANELHDRLADERRQAKYNKHYDICMQILLEMVDFSCKVGEYRELTEKLVPAKLYREWKDLFLCGLPLYEVEEAELSPEELEKEREIAAEKERLLDEGDFMEYKNLVGEWVPGDGQDIQCPPKGNAVLGHIVQRLFNIVSPPQQPPPPPEFPPFPIKACFLGKFFSGKSTVIKKIAEYHRIVRLSMDTLVTEAIEAHKNGEVYEEVDGELKIQQATASKRPSIADEPIESPKPEGQGASESRVVSAGSAAVSGGSTKGTPDLNKVPADQVGERTEEQDEKRDKTKEEIAKEREKQAKSSAASEKKTFEVSMYKSGPKGPKPTPRAKLGARAYAYLKKGKPTPDQLIVEIMVEAIRNVPEGTGWIMDGFPATINQAKILEKALTGYDDQKQGKESKSAKEPGKVSKTKKSRLAPDPHPAPEVPSHKAGIDLVVLFDLPDEVALRRAEGRTFNPITEEKFHQEYNPPLEGSYTGINKQEKVVTVVDSSNDREQVQQRITGFLDAWPKLEKWFNRFGVLQKLNADTPQDDLYEDASGVINETYQKIMAPPEEPASEVASVQPSVAPEGEAQPHEEPLPSAEGAPPDGGAPTEAQSTTSPVAPSESAISKSEKGASKTKSAKTKTESKTGSPKGGRKMSKKDRSPSPSASKKGVKSRSPSPPAKKGSGSRAGSKSPPPSRKGSRPGSKGSRPGSKRSKSPKKGEEPEEEKPPEPEGPPEPEPGSDEWEYINQPIEKEFAAVLARQWENNEDTYVETCKIIFRTIRHERELIYRYFYGTRKDFVDFLKRPDEKQEYVLQWQKEFNEIAEDMRNDDDTKAEWHQRVDDLCDRLHEICDNRKEMAEKERQTIMNEGWLEDRLGVLTNHYIGIMQVEVDRYQDTIRLLRDYYMGMEVASGKVPCEPVNDYVRLPLVELPPTLRPQSASSRASDSTGNLNAEKSETKSPSAKKEKDKGSPKTPEPTEGVEEEQKPRIPLVPRRPKSSEGGTGKGRDKRTGQKKDKQSDPDKPETPVPPSDPDERLVFDAYMLALTVIEALAALDVADQEAEAQRQVELEREKEKELLQKKVKENKGKKGRKSPVKSPSKTETPPPPPPEETEGESEEEKLKQKIRERSRKEFLASVASEDKGLKSRLEMVKAHTMAVLQELKGKAESMYKDMEDWLGERFLQEVESIKAMAATIRFAIEQENKLQEETILEDKDFVVDLDTKTFKTPTPPPPPVQIEIPTSDSFTVSQILNLCNQFIEAAPSGVISNRGFCDVIMDLTNLTFGTESLPDIWMNITQQQLQDICGLLSPDSEFIDWRKFLLAAAQPWTPPNKMDLLITLERFRTVDQGGVGLIDEAQYAEVDMWFSKLISGEEQPEVPELVTAYDRLDKLKEAFFYIFANHNLQPAPLLDYANMLMYFAADSDAMEGFLRALSISTGQPMPSSDNLSSIPLTDSQAIEIQVPLIQTPGTPPPEMESLVHLDDLLAVLHHGQSRLGDTHRLSVTSDPADSFARERLAGLFIELGADEEEALPFHLLYQHPIMQDCMQTCMIFKSVDLKSAFKGISSSSYTFE